MGPLGTRPWTPGGPQVVSPALSGRPTSGAAVRVLALDPNTTASMADTTDTIRALAEAGARPGTEIVANGPLWGPESTEGHCEGHLSAAAVLDRRPSPVRGGRYGPGLR